MKQGIVLAGVVCVAGAVAAVLAWAVPVTGQPIGQPVQMPMPMPMSTSERPATNMQALYESPGRIVLMDEYRVGETDVAGPALDQPPVRVRYAGVVMYERGREDQRVKGLQISVERPGQEEVVCFVDRGEMEGLSRALMQLADMTSLRRAREWNRDNRGRPGRPNERLSSKHFRFSTADFAVQVRQEGGRPVVSILNPNHDETTVDLREEGDPALFEQWSEWVQEAHRMLERK
jgi:hypothetical protein